jgi:hypothetical protein
MAVAVDAVSSADTKVVNGTNASITNNNLTVGTGQNMALIAALLLRPDVANLAVVWGAQTMTQIGKLSAATSTLTAYLFGLIAPQSGNQSLVASWTSQTVEAYLDCMSFSGVSQVPVPSSFPNFISTTIASGATTATIVINTASGNYTFSTSNTAAGTLNAGNPQSSLNQTLLHYDHSASLTNFWSQYAASVGLSTTHTATYVNQPAENDPLIGCDILAFTPVTITFAGQTPLVMM